MKKKILLIVTLLIMVTGLFAQEESSYVIELSIDEAVSLALDNNISIQQSKISLDLLEAKKKSSWNSISPSLSVGATMANSGDIAKDPVFPELEAGNFSANASLRLSFTPALFTQIKAAKLAYESGEASLESTKRAIELSVRKDFYRLLYTKENIELQEANLENSKQTYESSMNKYNSGRLSELDLLNSEYSYESKIPTVANIKNSYEASLDNFKQILGIPLDYDVILIGNLEDACDVSVSVSVESASVENNANVKNILRNIETQKNNLTASKVTAWSPSMTFSASASLAKKTEMQSMDPTTHLPITITSGPLKFNYSVGVSLPLDGYLPWSNGALSIKSQKANLKSLELELENAKVSATISIINSYNAIVQAQSQLKIYEKNAALSERTYQMTQKAYEAGSTDLENLNNAANNLATAKYNLQAQQYSIISAALDLENILGVPFGTFKTTEN